MLPLFDVVSVAVWVSGVVDVQPPPGSENTYTAPRPALLVVTVA